MRVCTLFSAWRIWIVAAAACGARVMIRIGRPLNIAIAKINFGVHCDELPVLVETPSASYEPFFTGKAVSGAGSRTIDIDIRIGDFPSTEALTEILEDCGAWSMFRKDDENFLVVNPSLAGGPESIVRFNPHLENAVVYCGKMEIVEAAGRKMVRNPLIYPVDQLLLMYMLAEKRGAVVHSAGVEFHDRGYMLTGRSGAGKSTLSRKFASNGYHVLSDDRIAVRKINDQFRMFGTPWSGEAGIAGNEELPLHAVFFIRHGKDNSAERISPAGVVERLMPVTSIPWYDEDTMAKVITFCEDLALNVPAYDLFFRPDINVEEFFDNFIPK